MFPDIFSCPVEVQRFPSLEGAVDAVFNPLVETEPPLRDGRKLVRDEQKEQEVILRLTHYGFKKKRDQMVLRIPAPSKETISPGLTSRMNSAPMMEKAQDSLLTT